MSPLRLGQSITLGCSGEMAKRVEREGGVREKGREVKIKRKREIELERIRRIERE